MAKPSGQKPHEPTEESRKLVQKLSGSGLPHDMICHIIGIKARDTLIKYYRDELDIGEATACAKVANRLFQKCMEGDTTSIIFWMKTRLKWRETDRKEEDSQNITKDDLLKAIFGKLPD